MIRNLPIQSRIIYSVFVGLIYSIISPAQNLLPNGDFENYRSCPGGMETIQYGLLIDWFQPVTDCTPDYFNVCGTARSSTIPDNTMGFQNASSGKGYIGLWAYLAGPVPSYTSEFIACQLKSPLEIGKTYKIKMNISLGNYSMYSLNGLGIAFTSFYPQFETPALLKILPHQQNMTGNQLTDTATWMPIEFDYTANGAENYFVIGNFNWIGNNGKKLPYKPDHVPFW